MLLSNYDAAQFFRLMWGLQFYVNQQRRLLPDVNSYEAYAHLDSQQKVIVRDALWKHPDFIEAYLQANPDKWSDEELILIGKWKGFITGKFYIFRYLKDHTIFMGNSHVYGVKGSFRGVLYRFWLKRYCYHIKASSYMMECVIVTTFILGVGYVGI